MANLSVAMALDEAEAEILTAIAFVMVEEEIFNDEEMVNRMAKVGAQSSLERVLALKGRKNSMARWAAIFVMRKRRHEIVMIELQQRQNALREDLMLLSAKRRRKLRIASATAKREATNPTPPPSNPPRLLIDEIAIEQRAGEIENQNKLQMIAEEEEDVQMTLLVGVVVAIITNALNETLNGLMSLCKISGRPILSRISRNGWSR